MTRGGKLVIGAVILVTVSVIPFPYLASPEWNVTVVDPVGRPMQGVTVRLSWENYSVENDSHEQDLTTDAQGHVKFPQHIDRAPFVRRIFFTACESMSLAHGGFGLHTFVFAFGDGLEGQAVTGNYETDWTGKPDHMESRIVINALRN
jgi:hypothetical protein